MSLFHSAKLFPQDPVFGLQAEFVQEARNPKINLGVGTYRGDDERPFIFNVVKEAEKRLLLKEVEKEYLPILGYQPFLKEAKSLLSLEEEGITSAQTIGGTGALRLAATCLKSWGATGVYIPNPTWANHQTIFEKAGLNCHTYPYYHLERHELDIEALLSFIATLPPKSALLLHGCCHNPTGVDPSSSQWERIADAVQKQEVLPLFDLAYQGFGQGLMEDAAAIRLFAAKKVPSLICQSFSKNFGLYGERLGALTLLFFEASLKNMLESELKTIVRSEYSNPPKHGALIVSEVLSSVDLNRQWQAELEAARLRIVKMRQLFIGELKKRFPETDLLFMERQQGMFSYTFLTEEMVLRLRKEFAIYLPTSGRVNIAGLTTSNLPIVIEAIVSVASQKF
ncbi:MAG: aspc1 [Chlamydiales bacterium]|jgi:aspartate/tyrosine/aromatic aminotransferase|nr:aspc1 [Chlamydiales bacterium]